MRAASGTSAANSRAPMLAPVVTAGRQRRSPCLMVLAISLAFATLLALVLLQVERNTLFITAGGPAPRSDRKQHLTTSRAGQFSFGLAESDDHSDLTVEEQDDGAVRVSSTPTKTMDGRWNTVLGNTPLPNSGRHYWEVKVVKKPTDNFECIGVAEASADVTVPLNKNKKGAGWFWSSSWSESMHWVPADITFEWPDVPAKAERLELIGGAKMRGTAESAWAAKNGVKGADLAFDFNKNPTKIHEQFKKPDTKFSGPVGTVPLTAFPAFNRGTVVGVDVDMDQGTLGFWADGKYLGVVRDMTGKPVDLKGKKVVPAVSLFGINTGNHKYYSEFELMSGLEPPAKP